MPNSFETITKYLTRAVDTVFAEESKTNLLEDGGKFVDLNFQEAGYVKVASILMDGLSDYYRVGHDPIEDSTNYSHHNPWGDGSQRDGYGVGSASLTWELFKLQYDRGKQFQVDYVDDEETAGLVIGNLVNEFLRTRVVPEIDAVRFSKLAKSGSTSLGNLVTETISDNAIISNFNKAYEWLAESEVPAEDQVIFVSPTVMTLIRNTTELYKRLTQDEYKNGDITFNFERYEGRPIIEVPSNRFFTDVAVTNNGYRPNTDSKVLNYVICSRRVAVPIVKLNKFTIFDRNVIQDFDGYKVNFRLYHDLLVPKNKIPGVYTSVSNTSATSKTNILAVDLSYVSENHYTLDRYFTRPAGLHGRVAVSSSAFTLGQTVSSPTYIGVGDTAEINGTSAYFALVDDRGLVVATSGSVTLPTA